MAVTYGLAAGIKPGFPGRGASTLAAEPAFQRLAAGWLFICKGMNRNPVLTFYCLNCISDIDIFREKFIYIQGKHSLIIFKILL